MIEKEGVRLRAVELIDVDLLYDWENDLSLLAFGNATAPYSKYQLTKFIESNSGDLYADQQIRLMVEVAIDTKWEVTGIIDGFDFDPYHQRCGVGIMIHKKHQEKGFALAALSLFSHYLFTTWNIHQLFATIESSNIPSIALFKKAGFKEIGIKKDWLRISGGYADAIDFQLINPQKVDYK